MSDNASQTREPTDRQQAVHRHERPPGVPVQVRGREDRDCQGEDPACSPTPTVDRQVPPAQGAGNEPAAYYRLRCIALEAAVDRLGDELERERRRLDEVVARYESILQERGAAGAVTDSRR